MQLALLKGYPDYIGKRQAFVGNGIGPKSYTQKTNSPVGGGDIIVYPPFGNYIDIVFPALTLSGTYIVYPYPVAVGPRQVWALMWVTRSSGTEVSAAVDLSAESVQLAGFAGVY